MNCKKAKAECSDQLSGLWYLISLPPLHIHHAQNIYHSSSVTLQFLTAFNSQNYKPQTKILVFFQKELEIQTLSFIMFIWKTASCKKYPTECFIAYYLVAQSRDFPYD